MNEFNTEADTNQKLHYQAMAIKSRNSKLK